MIFQSHDKIILAKTEDEKRDEEMQQERFAWIRALARKLLPNEPAPSEQETKPSATPPGSPH